MHPFISYKAARHNLLFILFNLLTTCLSAQSTTVDTPLSISGETIKNEANKGIKTSFLEDSTCIDLCFDSVSVIKLTEKYIEIEYSIVNKGTAPAPIFGSQRTFKDNVAVHFYFSGTPRLNRGSIIGEAIYLTDGLRASKGLLAPKAVYKNRIKLRLEKRSRFYGVIILQLDAFDILRHECDETNNVFSIVPKWY